MGNFETGGFDFWRDPEVREVSGRREREPSNEADEVDLRHESEVFQDHERIDNSKDIDQLEIGRASCRERV